MEPAFNEAAPTMTATAQNPTADQKTAYLRSIDALERHVRIVPGWFHETLPPHGMHSIAAVRDEDREEPRRASEPHALAVLHVALHGTGSDAAACPWRARPRRVE